MKKPTVIQLTKSIIDSITPEEIIYAEAAGSGAMGRAGEIMLYIIVDKSLICYETNVFIDEEIYVQANKLLDDKLFNYFYGGMGNDVFVDKNITLEIQDGYFIYKKDDIDYQIIPSVKGVFNNVVYAMKNPKRKPMK